MISFGLSLPVLQGCAKAKGPAKPDKAETKDVSGKTTKETPAPSASPVAQATPVATVSPAVTPNSPVAPASPAASPSAAPTATPTTTPTVPVPTAAPVAPAPTAAPVAQPTPAPATPAPNPNAKFSWINDNIINNKCIGCHGGGDFDLSSYDAIKGLVTPFKPNESIIYQAITRENDRMPMNGDKLTDAEIQAIYDWITAGAANN